jgi:hypothetical protein
MKSRVKPELDVASESGTSVQCALSNVVPAAVATVHQKKVELNTGVGLPAQLPTLVRKLDPSAISGRGIDGPERRMGAMALVPVTSVLT